MNEKILWLLLPLCVRATELPWNDLQETSWQDMDIDQELKKFPPFQRRKNICPKCDEAFSCSNGLKKHLLQHEMVTDYRCIACHLFFKNNIALGVHNRHRHFHVTNRTCQTCNMSFTWTKMLVKHLESHTVETNYRCCIVGCGRFFKDQRSLNMHRAQKHPDEVQKICLICDERFDCPSRLATHTAMMHKDS